MSRERFERVKDSVIEAGQVIRGERPPSREFAYEIELTGRSKSRQADWAICLTRDEDAFVPLKLYRVKFSTTGHASSALGIHGLEGRTETRGGRAVI